MTVQIIDHIMYINKDYSVLTIKGTNLFVPESYGLRPISPHTANYRGWQGKYTVYNDKLLLSDLRVFHDASINTPTINGHSPTVNEHSLIAQLRKQMLIADCTYSNLDMAIDFTGGMLIVDDCIKLSGCHYFWRYTDVFELVFQQGQLISANNHSDFVQAIREKYFIDNELDTVSDVAVSRNKELNQWIKNTLKFDYYSFVGKSKYLTD